MLAPGSSGKQIEPPVEHAVRLGEEAMAAEVDPVSVVDAGAREPTDFGAAIEHRGDEIGPSQQLERRGEAGRARPDDDRPSSRHGRRVFRAAVRVKIGASLTTLWKSEQG